MFACEISMIYLCIFETIYAVLLLRVGRVVVHLCDHNYSYGRIGGLRQGSGSLRAEKAGQVSMSVRRSASLSGQRM